LKSLAFRRSRLGRKSIARVTYLSFAAKKKTAHWRSFLVIFSLFLFYQAAKNQMHGFEKTCY